MILNNLFEGSIDELEKRRIKDLELKMDDLAARAKETKDPRVVAALRQEFAKAKAERDSYHYVQEWEDTAPGHNATQTELTPVEEEYKPVTKPVPQPRKLNPGWALDPTTRAELKRRKDVRRRTGIDEHGGGGGGPAQWHAYVKAHRADEGWQDFNKVEPYEVCLAGKPIKTFDYYEEARRFHDNWKQKLYREGNKEKADRITLNPIMKEGSMADASHHETGPKFGGYYKGTQVGAPRPGQSFGAESVQHEGAKVDRMVKHIAKSERDLGKSKKDAEAIAWATANKRGYLDNANKKDESVDNSHETNFLSWVLNQGKRFQGFTANPETYAAAKEAYKREHGAEATFSEGMSNALSNITRRIAQPVNANKIIKNREQKKDSLKRQHFAEDDITEIKKSQKDSNGNTSCWDGYHADGTKKGKNGGQVRNCVPNESIEEDWQKANKKDKTDGMSQKAVNAYKRENPGSKLKTAVTTPPSKLKKGSKDSKRRKSYCARSAGQKKMHNIDCSKTPDKAICKARKRWNCESQEQFDAMLREAVEKSELQPGQYYVWTVYFDDGTNKRVKVTKDTFDPKAYYAKQNKVVVNVDYDWTPKNG